MQAVGSTTTLFVFVIGVLLTLLFPKVSRENLSGREFAQKGIAAVLVAIGVALVSRSSPPGAEGRVSRQRPPEAPSRSSGPG